MLTFGVWGWWWIADLADLTVLENQSNGSAKQPKFDFLDDFAMPALKEEFLRFLARTDEVAELPARASRDQAYAAASDRVLDGVDVLVAVRDGQAAQGRAETAEVVARGHARRLPLAWVHGGNRKSGTVEATSPGADQGRVTHENLLR